MLAGRWLIALGITLVLAAVGRTEESEAKSEAKVDPIVVIAKYTQTLGPCIDLGNGRARPLIDEFEVVELRKGTLPKSVKSIEVRDHSGEFGKLQEGETYRLMLVPSARTIEQLKEREQDDHCWLWVDASELKVHRVTEATASKRSAGKR